MEQKNNFFQLKNFAQKYLKKYLEKDRAIILGESGIDGTSLISLGRALYLFKISSPVMTAKNRRSAAWDFDLRGNKWMNGRNVKIDKQSNCDYYLLLGIENDEPKKVFLIPAAEAPSSHVRIPLSGNSKYFKYAI